MNHEQPSFEPNNYLPFSPSLWKISLELALWVKTTSQVQSIFHCTIISSYLSQSSARFCIVRPAQ